MLLLMLVVKRNVIKPFSDVTVGRMEECRKSARVTNGAEVSGMRRGKTRDRKNKEGRGQ